MSDAAVCNGIKLQTLNQDCNRIAVKSSVQSSWNPTFKERLFSRAKAYDIGITKNEILVISFQDGSGHAEFEIEPLGDRAGVLVAQHSTRGTKTLRVGQKYRYELECNRSLILRSAEITFHDGTRPRG
jgi:hypothetical protein